MQLETFLDGDGLLAPRAFPYRATLDDVYKAFVVGAPYRARREMIFRALSLFCDLVWEQFPEAVMWIDGGFTTHKSWEPPEDADVAVFVSPARYPEAYTEKNLPIWTLQRVTAEAQDISTGKLHPFGGLLDTFCLPDQLGQRMVWARTWSSVRGPDRSLIPNKSKGFVEVVKP